MAQHKPLKIVSGKTRRWDETSDSFRGVSIGLGIDAAASGLSIGSGPVADVGDIRLDNDTTCVATRNVGADGNIILLRTDSSNYVYFGGNTSTAGTFFDSPTGTLHTFRVNSVPSVTISSSIMMTEVPIAVNAASGYADAGDLRHANNTTCMAARNQAGGANLSLITTNASDHIIVGASTIVAEVKLDAVTSLGFLLSGGNKLVINSATVDVYTDTLRFLYTNPPTITQYLDTTAGVTADNMTIEAQGVNDAAGNATSGNLLLRGGRGTGGGGNTDGNVAFGEVPGSNDWKSAEECIFIADCVTAPTGAAIGGSWLYSVAGVLNISGGGDVSASAVIVDHTIVRGDGGGKGVQDCGITISDADVMAIPSGGGLDIIGTGDQVALLHGDDWVGLTLKAYRSATWPHAMLNLYGARGTEASSSNLLAGDVSGTISYRGHGATTGNFVTMASLDVYALENVTDAAAGGELGITTTDYGALTTTLAFKVNSTLATFSVPIAVNAGTVATAGDIRLADVSTIQAVGAASANYALISKTAGDSVYVGGPYTTRPPNIHIDASNTVNLEIDGSSSFWINSTVTSSVKPLGIGTGTVPHGGVGAAMLAIDGANASAAGPHIQLTTVTDDYPVMQIFAWAHDNSAIRFDAYYDGVSEKSSDVGSNFMLNKGNDQFLLWYDSGVAQGGDVVWNQGLSLNTSGIVNIPTALSVGGTTSTTGDIRGDSSFSLLVKDGAAADTVLLSWGGGSDNLNVGDATKVDIVYIKNTTKTEVRIGTAPIVRMEANLTTFGSAAASYDIVFDDASIEPMLYQASEITNVAGDDLIIRAQASVYGGGTNLSGNLGLAGGQTVTSNKDGNVWFNAAPSSFQAMERGIFIGNVAAVPTDDPSQGGFFYTSAGVLKYRGTSGTTTIIAPA